MLNSALQKSYFSHEKKILCVAFKVVMYPGWCWGGFLVLGTVWIIDISQTHRYISTKFININDIAYWGI